MLFPLYPTWNLRTWYAWLETGFIARKPLGLNLPTPSRNKSTINMHHIRQPCCCFRYLLLHMTQVRHKPCTTSQMFVFRRLISWTTELILVCTQFTLMDNGEYLKSPHENFIHKQINICHVLVVWSSMPSMTPVQQNIEYSWLASSKNTCHLMCCYIAVLHE